MSWISILDTKNLSTKEILKLLDKYDRKKLKAPDTFWHLLFQETEMKTISFNIQQINDMTSEELFKILKEF